MDYSSSPGIFGNAPNIVRRLPSRILLVGKDSNYCEPSREHSHPEDVRLTEK